jgi:UDP-N-acetylglucosamine 2-epimerase (hydrolysing)
MIVWRPCGTLAGAIVGSLNNILVAHIEGGELSGTVMN